jgi:hypothetical protein
MHLYDAARSLSCRVRMSTLLRSATCRARSGAFDEDGHGLGDIDAQQLESLKFEREVSKHNVAVGAVARAVSDVHVQGVAAPRGTFAFHDCVHTAVPHAGHRLVIGCRAGAPTCNICSWSVRQLGLAQS